MIEHEKPGNFPCSKRASKASPEPWTFPAPVGVRRVGSGRNGSLHNFLVFGMARGASDAKRLSAKIATSDHRKKGKMPRQRLGPSSPSWRSIPFGKGLAETGQTRQRLGVSCDLTRNNGATGEMGKAQQKKKLAKPARGWESREISLAQCSPNSSCSSFFHRRTMAANHTR